MQVAKLRVAPDETGLVPAGTYFMRVAAALRDANEKARREEALPKRTRRPASAPVAAAR